jgi:predicted lipoprotein with Yx(FWY)xxD motif
MHSARRLLANAPPAAALAVVLALTAGGSASGAAPEPGAAEALTAKSKGAKLRLVKSEYGRVLMNGRGRALYLFTRDSAGASECHGDCAVAWPPYLSRAKPVAGKGVDSKRLRTVRRPDGTRQLAYAGHPLYFYERDSPGNIFCQDVFEFGGRWLLVDARGRAVR